MDTKLVNEAPLIENMNRLEPETIDASGIDEAIKALRLVSNLIVEYSNNS